MKCGSLVSGSVGVGVGVSSLGSLVAKKKCLDMACGVVVTPSVAKGIYRGVQCFGMALEFKGNGGLVPHCSGSAWKFGKGVKHAFAVWWRAFGYLAKARKSLTSAVQWLGLEI